MLRVSAVYGIIRLQKRDDRGFTYGIIRLQRRDDRGFRLIPWPPHSCVVVVWTPLLSRRQDTQLTIQTHST